MNRFSVLTGVPEMTKGLVSEIRVRWALEEMGLPYEEIRYPHPETKKEEYLKKQPFGQVPYFTSGDLSMFESGAILLHLALKHNKLLPADETERAQTLTWLFAALTSIETYFLHNFLLLFDPDATEGMKERAKKIIQDKLAALSTVLGEREYFGSDFSIADICMTAVLRRTDRFGFLAPYENLVRYVKRNEARPAFQRAISGHEKLYSN